MIEHIKYIFILGLMFANQICIAQNTPSEEEKLPTTSIDGYVKLLPSYITFTSGDQKLFDVLLHNRINFEWFPNDKFTFKAALRNRVFFGDQVSGNPSFGKLIDQGGNDFVDLSTLLVDSENVVAHSYFDRFYAEYTSGKWEVRLGRQRINWGISTIWNPNDIFNAYSFTDFDYEERPGSDALRIKKYIGFSSSFEFAYSPADPFKGSTLALLYKGNIKNYDVQFLSGYHNDDFVLGLGWAGNIKTAGWKAEMSYFTPLGDDRISAFSLAMNFDYAFIWGFYANIGVLYNSEGGVDGGLSELFATTLSARNLYPYRWSIMTNFATPISPIMNIGLTAVYSPVRSNALFLVPTYGISVGSSWSFDIVMQLLFESNNKSYTSPLKGYFLRSKYSF